MEDYAGLVQMACFQTNKKQNNGTSLLRQTAERRSSHGGRRKFDLSVAGGTCVFVPPSNPTTSPRRNICFRRVFISGRGNICRGFPLICSGTFDSVWNSYCVSEKRKIERKREKCSKSQTLGSRKMRVGKKKLEGSNLIYRRG